ncbi:hypothetical protein T492DRAFT_914248 [Pavlovales sp. CCMP2436]|nr:hypothetical protein T492DRAFT_914248 [Pavlovales sp. CCMP2436]
MPAVPNTDQLTEIERMSQLGDQLREAQRARFFYNLRFTWIPLTLGIAFGLGGVLLRQAWSPNMLSDDVARTVPVLVLIYVSIPLALVSAPPSSAHVVVGLCLLYIVMLALTTYLNLLQAARFVHNTIIATPVCGMRYHLVIRMQVFIILGVVHMLAIAVLLTRLIQHSASRIPLGWLRPITTRDLLRSMWHTIGYIYSASACAWLIFVAAYGAIVPAWRTTTMFAGLVGMLFLWVPVTVIAFSTRVRARVHAWLAARGHGVSAAAGVAALIGDADPQDAIAEGRRRLRAVSFSGAVLEADVFSSSAPSEYWRSMCVPAELDSIDVFVSHSWHDDPVAKWSALQEWRAEFVERNRREPLVWIDRCCLLEPGQDLLSLPIFLAGCRKLLILAGPTFINRLWCIVEMFIFEQMHPFDFKTASDATLSSHVELRPLPGCDLLGFESFSVDMAVCSVPADKEHFLTCIETACGSTRDFNTRIRHLLCRLRKQHASHLVAEHLASVSVRVMPVARAEAPVEATTPRRRDHWNGGRWCLLGLVAVLMVIYGVLFAAYASRLSVPILADCAACQSELRALSLDSHGYYNDDAGEARSGRAYRYSGTRAHATRALFASAAAEVCASENGTLAVPRSTTEARRLSCIVGSDAFGVWIGADPSEVAGDETDKFRKCVLMNPWGWTRSACGGFKNHYICERG